jgi:hypothetical protein
MRFSHRKAVDTTALLSIVGNSVMAVVAGPRGFDDDESAADEHPAPVRRAA